MVCLRPVSIIFLIFQALEKSKYEQSLDSVRRFIAIAEKELELYYRHVALYGDPNDRNPNSILDKPRSAGKFAEAKSIKGDSYSNSDDCSQTDSMGEGISESEDLSEYDDSYVDDNQFVGERDSEDDKIVINASDLLTKKEVN